MSWTDAHRFYDALRVIEEELNRRGDGVVPWRPDYDAIFGSPARLALVLRTRWQTMVDAQVEFCYDELGRPSDQLRALAAAHPGLVRAIAEGDRTGALLPVTDGYAAVGAGDESDGRGTAA